MPTSHQLMTTTFFWYSDHIIYATLPVLIFHRLHLTHKETLAALPSNQKSRPRTVTNARVQGPIISPGMTIPPAENISLPQGLCACSPGLFGVAIKQWPNKSHIAEVSPETAIFLLSLGKSPGPLNDSVPSPRSFGWLCNFPQVLWMTLPSPPVTSVLPCPSNLSLAQSHKAYYLPCSFFNQSSML